MGQAYFVQRACRATKIIRWRWELLSLSTFNANRCGSGIHRCSQLRTAHVYVFECVAGSQVQTPVPDWAAKHLFRTDRLSDELDYRCVVRPPSRLVFNWDESFTLDHDAVTATAQPVYVGGDVHCPVDLYAVATLVSHGIDTLMLEMTPGRVIVVGEVLLLMDDRPLAGTVNPVLDLRQQHPVVVSHR
jgi:hypothetical protein